MPADHPFSGTPLNRRERNLARKRALERARARTELEEYRRQLHPTPEGSPTTATGHGRPPTAPAQEPSTFGHQAGDTTQAYATPDLTEPIATTEPVAPEATEAAPVTPVGRTPGTAPGWAGSVSPWGGYPSGMAAALPTTTEYHEPTQHSGPIGHLLDQSEHGVQNLRQRLSGPWGPTASTVGVVAGLILALAGLFVGLAVGGPVLGHPGRPVPALAGAAAFGAGALWASRGWAAAGRKTRMTAAVLTLAIGSSFTVGTLTNPVVVDGTVYLSTSTQARSYRLIQDIRTDLLFLAQADAYLTFNAAQAGAHFGEYAPLTDAMLTMSETYARLAEQPERLPDPRFAGVVNQVTAAAFWGAKAMTSKTEVIEADNARSQADLAGHRASYAESVLAAGDTLRAVAAELNLPITQMGPTE